MPESFSGQVREVSARRLRPYLPVILPACAAALYGWAVFASTFHHSGSIGMNYDAPGTDWMALYGAIRLALTHQFALTRDGMLFTNHLNATFADWLSKPMEYRPWVYPPSFLVILWPFGALNFPASYVAFQVASAALLATALLYRADRRWAAPLIALGMLICPAASINAVEGQCSFLFAGVLVLGMRLLPARPLLAGVVLGVLLVKPQFGLLVPVALLAGGHWRSLAGAAGSALALVAVSAIAFGPEIWGWWLGQAISVLSDSQSEWTRAGRLWGSSVWTCMVFLGMPQIASLVQWSATLAAAVAVYGVYRSKFSADRRLIVLLACTFLAAPHSLANDEIFATIAGALWFAEQPAPQLRDGIVVMGLWAMPIFGLPALTVASRFVPLFVAGFIVLSLRHPLRR